MTQAFTAGRYSRPKTILGFLAAVVVIASSFSLAAIIALKGTAYEWLIAVILLFDLVGFVAIVAVVLWLAHKDPTPLVVGEMSGQDYTAHQEMLLGDNERGERREAPALAPIQSAPTIESQGPGRELPAGEED